jgi:hypothetical protein
VFERTAAIRAVVPISGRPKYAPNMRDSRTLSTTTAAAVVGGVLAAAIVWLSRPDPPSCTTLDNGMRACMPIYVVDPPLWLYGAVAVVGALLDAGVAFGYTTVRRCAR